MGPGRNMMSVCPYSCHIAYRFFSVPPNSIPCGIPGPLKTLNGIRGDTRRGLWSFAATVMVVVPLSTAVLVTTPPSACPTYRQSAFPHRHITHYSNLTIFLPKHHHHQYFLHYNHRIFFYTIITTFFSTLCHLHILFYILLSPHSLVHYHLHIHTLHSCLNTTLIYHFVITLFFSTHYHHHIYTLHITIVIFILEYHHHHILFYTLLVIACMS